METVTREKFTTTHPAAQTDGRIDGKASCVATYQMRFRRRGEKEDSASVKEV